jgi:hypothetical protein
LPILDILNGERSISTSVWPFPERLQEHLVHERIEKASCIDGRYLSRLFNALIDTRPAATRKECGCTKSVDIGAYDTCGHGCVYCYANMDKDRACSNVEKHNPEWNSLKMNVAEETVRQEIEQGAFRF